MILDKKCVDKAREIIEAKRPYWERTTGFKFDKDGRAYIGTMSSFDKRQWDSLIGNNISKRFEKCFEIGLEKMGIKPFPLRDLTYEDYKAKTVKIINKHGKEQEIKITRLLQKAQDEWETQMSIYKAFRQHMKEVRNSDEYTEMHTLNDILNNMNKGNICLAYDKLLKDNQELKVLLSMNPLDKIFASGGADNENVGDSHITKFYSCWSNAVSQLNNGCYGISPRGMYANPEAQIALGSHISSGMIIMKNGNELEVDGMKFFGMGQRSHVWVYDDGIFVENMYPSKYKRDKIEEINGLLSKHINVVEPTRWTKIKFSDDTFNKDQWFSELQRCIGRGKELYIDRGAILRKTKDVYIGPTFRYGNHGGTMWTPQGVR